MHYVNLIGTAESSFRPIELYKREVIKHTKDGKQHNLIDVSDVVGKKHAIEVSWLKKAAEKYLISPNIEDFVIAPVPIVTSDIPNRNMQAFTLKSLLDFSVQHGCLRYRTFVGKPTCSEHDNKDPKKAKGVNFDATLKKVGKYNVVKVLVLGGFDRTKDSQLASSILKGHRNSYSMGAVCTTFKCSICGGVLGPNITRTCSCRNTCFTQLGSLGRVIHGKLHYHMAVDPVFIEQSSVSEPADTTALTTPI